MSEENKNLNEQPEVAPVEKKEEAPVAKKPLTKQQIGIIAGIAAAVVVLIVVLALVLGGGKDPHSHSYVDGKCECGESDPNYVPPHTHSYVDGKCECGATDPSYVPPHTHSYVEGKCECGATDPSYVPEGPAVTNKEYTLGMGVVFGSMNATQTNLTIATVVLDENGVIVAVKLDAVQNKYAIGESVQFSNLLTKKELGFDYNMAKYGQSQDRNGDGKVLEWFEQAAAFEAWCVGKTVEDIANMATQTQDDGYVIPADEALLTAGCTIQITDFRDAVVKACNDDQAATFVTAGEITLGLGVNSANDGSNGDDFEATVKMNVEFAAVASVDGVIVAALNDAAQPQIKVEDGTTVISTSVGKGEGILKTKRELKEDYKMAAYGQNQDRNGDGKVLEWYLQSAAFSAHVVGMTAEEVYNLATQTQDDGYVIPADEALLTAGCTIQITGIKAVVAEAAGYVASEKEYTLGMGVVFGSMNATQTNITIATVVLDENGVIVAVKIDAVQNKYSITDSVQFSNLLTKKELGFDYHMAAYGQNQDRNGDGKVLEWFEQAAAFEAWCVGKTVEDIANMATQTQDDGYVIPADEALLTAGCTIQITDFRDAVVKACNDDQAATFVTAGEITLGLGVNSANDGSNGDDFEATVKMNVEFAAVASVDGVIVAALNDAAQPQIKVEDGTTVISTSVGKGEGILKTKRELKEDYKMAAYGQNQDRNGDGKVLEWYLQSAAFSAHVVGLTAEQVYNLATQTQADGYVIPADEALLTAGCTIQITGIKAVVAEAAGYVA